MIRSAAVLSMLFSVAAEAFIPPVPALVRDAYEGRKGRRATEVVLRHSIDVRPGETIELEERIGLTGGKPVFLFRAVGQSQPFVGVWDRRQYIVDEKAYPARTGIFLKYLLGTSPDEFLSTLLAEGFVRRDQLPQFKQGWTPEGDPALWDVKGNYLRHPEIYLSRLKHGNAVAVVGTDEGGARKAVYFDPSGRGVRRFEWREGGVQLAWELDGFQTFAKEGTYPRRLHYEVNGDEKIRSELVSVRALSDRTASELAIARSRPRVGISPSVEAAVQLLLGLR